MARYPSLPALRTCLLASGVLGVAALASCMDREPAGLDPSAAALSSHITTPGALTVVARGGNTCPTEGMTAWLLHPGSGIRRDVRIDSRGEAVFDFSTTPLLVGDRVIVGVEFNPYDNVLEQRTNNGNAFFAPFNVPRAQPTPRANDSLCFAAIYVASGNASGNNWVPKTVEHLEAIYTTSTSPSWLTLTSGAQKTQPMTFGNNSTAGLSGRLRSRVVDADGNPVSFNGNVFGFQPIRPEQALAGIPCASGDITEIRPGYQRWFCSLERGIFGVQGTASNGVVEMVLPPGVVMLELRGTDNRGRTISAAKPGRVRAGQTEHDVMMVVPSVRYSYEFDRLNTGEPHGVPYSRTGFEIDGGSLTGLVQGYWTLDNGPTIVELTVVENPDRRNPKTTTVRVECGTAAAPTSCRQVGVRSTFAHGGIYNPETRSGQGVISIPVNRNTTTACVSLRFSVDGSGFQAPTPLLRPGQPIADPAALCPSPGMYLEAGFGGGSTFGIM